MFESIMKFFKRNNKKKELSDKSKSKEAAKERLHLVLMQDRANVSVDFLELMKQEIIDVIKKYIEVDEDAIDVRLTNKENEDGTNGAPALYANIPILNIKNEVKNEIKNEKQVQEKEENKEEQHKEDKEEQKKEEQKDQPEDKKEEKKSEINEKEKKEQEKIKTKDKNK